MVQPRIIWSWLLALIVALLLAACGEGGGEPADCPFGVRDGAGCANAQACFEVTDCLPGYRCAGGVCVAEQSCEQDADCDAGVCGGDGACINPESCDANTDCVAKTYCADDGTCHPDPCVFTTCTRGACVPGTGECASKNPCSPDNELFDCVQGERCLEQECLDAEAFCRELDCQRGVCSFTDGGCVSAADCDGDDARCVAGEFCADADECRPDACAEEGVSCDDGGVCVPSVGECQNAESCDANADCRPDHWCIDGTCTLESTACGRGAGEGGCPGRQSCVYDAQELSASCVEPDRCETSLDCQPGRQCGGRRCLEARACRDDLHEPNSTLGTPTDFAGTARDRSIRGSVCPGDEDWFWFDVDDLEGYSPGRILVVDLEYARRDRGLGELAVELQKARGDGSYESVAMDDTGPAGRDGHVRIEHSLASEDAVRMLVAVRGVEPLEAAGVTYDLTVRVLDDLAVDACESPRSISNRDILTSNMQQARSTLLQGSCAPSETAPEQVFEFEVTEPSEVSVQVTPERAEDEAVVSVRRRCDVRSTERACGGASGEYEGGVQDVALAPGTYFLVVEPAPVATLGRYDVALDMRPTSCAPADDHCSDSTHANYCVDGTAIEQVACADGCDPTVGRCARPLGDVCERAERIQGAVTRFVEWDELRDDYRAPDCVGRVDGTRQSDGPDLTYEVDVPDGYGLWATMTMAPDERGSLYVVEDCSAPYRTCRAGVSITGRDRVRYPNRSGDAKTVTLVADTAAGQQLQDAQLEIELVELICDPGGSSATRCAPSSDDATEVCVDGGTRYDEGQSCSPWWCEAGACLSPQDCAATLDVTTQARQVGGFRIVDRWGNYTDALSGEGCKLDASDTVGFDFTVSVDLLAGESLTANLQTSESMVEANPALYVQPACGPLDDATCLAGARGEDRADVVYHATQDETVYVTADSSSTSSFAAQDSFEFDVAVTSTCDPETFATTCDSGAVAFCRPDGAVAYYPCDSGACTSGYCDHPTSDWCFDAEDVTAEMGSDTGLERTIDWANYSDDFRRDGACGGLSAERIDGADAYFRVDLQAGEVLNAVLDDGPQGLTFPALAVVSAADCVGADVSNACLDAAHDTDEAQVRYEAAVDETVYLIVDNDYPSGATTSELSASVRQMCDASSFAAQCDGDAVLYCDADGLQQSWACGAGGCSGGECNDQSGEYCFDAVDVTSSASQPAGAQRTVDFGLHDDDFRAESSCGLSSGATDGPDAYYTVSLAAGEVVVATLDPGQSSDQPALALVSASECELAGASQGSCLAADDAGSGLARVQYEATSDEDVRIIADVDDPSSTAQMALDVRIRQACDPANHSPSCVGNAVEYCNAHGFVERYTCAASSCSGGTCTGSNADYCFTAPNITAAAESSGGTTVTGDWAQQTDQFDLSGACGLSASLSEGPDAVYRVDMEPGERLDASLDGGGASATLAAVEECTDPAGSCADGDSDFSGQTSVGYFSETSTTVYLVADTYTDSASGSYTLNVEVTLAECFPSTSSPVCDGSGDIEYCDEGVLRTYRCDGGCSGGACGTPRGDRCFDAIALGDGDSDVRNFDGERAIEVYEGSSGACNFTSSNVPESADHIYRIDLQQGETLTVSYETGIQESSTTLGVMYLLDECGDVDSCLTNGGRYPQTGVGTLTYSATADSPVYLVVARNSSVPSSSFDYRIAVDIQ